MSNIFQIATVYIESKKDLLGKMIIYEFITHDNTYI